MKNKYKVVALVPLEFSVEGSSDSKEAIESVKNIFEACRNDNDCADIVFDGIEESLRHDSIEYKVEAAQPEPEVKANSDIRSVASDICDVFENYLDEKVVYIVCDDADEEQDQKANESGRFFYGSSYMREGQDCQCHYNSARLWYKNKDRCFIATGYALSEDGLWRCHSWVVQPMARTVRVWETTVKRVAYFGVVLTSEECEDFVENNT